MKIPDPNPYSDRIEHLIELMIQLVFKSKQVELMDSEISGAMSDFAFDQISNLIDEESQSFIQY